MDEPSKIQSMAERCRIDMNRAISEREEDRLERVSKLVATMEHKFNKLVVPQIKLKARLGIGKFVAAVFSDEAEGCDLRNWLTQLREYNLLNALADMARALPYGFLVDINYDQTMITFGW